MTRSERFSDAMHSLDLKTAGMRDSSKATFLSDHGEGVERMVNAIDHTEQPALTPTLYTRRLEAAVKRLTRANLDYLVPTLRLIAENRGNRQESIGVLAKRNKVPNKTAMWLYFGHREKLLNFFFAQ